MTPEQSGTEQGDMEAKQPAEAGKAAEPAPPEDAEPAPLAEEPSKGPSDEEWVEEYEKETDQAKPRKPKHLGGIVVTAIVILFMVVWTVMSPSVLSRAGTTYLDSERYANLGDYSGERDIWWLGDSVHVCTTTWGVSMSGEQNVSANETASFEILVTKVAEETGNWWFVGTAIRLTNVSLYLDDGTYLGSMVNQTRQGFGPLATVDVQFPDPGSHNVQVFLRFSVYTVMRIRYLPLETVEITADFDVPINGASQHS